MLKREQILQGRSKEDLGNLPRQELTFVACDVLAAENRKPSVALVRETTIEISGKKKGSDGDVQEDIRLWYKGLFDLKADAQLGDMPQRVATLLRAAWRGAVEEAEQGLVVMRDTLTADRERWSAEVDQAHTVADGLRHELAMANSALDARDETIARLDDVIVETRAENVQLGARLAAKNERIEALTAELARKSAEQAAALVEMDGARRHALMQIDHARGEGRHWKEQFERSDQEARGARTAADTYRSKASNLETTLAGATGRLETLQESLASERQRGVALTAQLEAGQQALRRSDEGLVQARIAVETGQARLEAAQNDLSAAHGALAEARLSERRALEEAAQLRGAVPALGSPQTSL